MRFVEFALRGVRRFEGGRKFAFHEGYNVLSGPNESGKTTCLLALLATLEPDRLGGGPGGPPAGCATPPGRPAGGTSTPFSSSSAPTCPRPTPAAAPARRRPGRLLPRRRRLRCPPVRRGPRGSPSSSPSWRAT